MLASLLSVLDSAGRATADDLAKASQNPVGDIVTVPASSGTMRDAGRFFGVDLFDPRLLAERLELAEELDLKSRLGGEWLGVLPQLLEQRFGPAWIKEYNTSLFWYQKESTLSREGGPI